MCTFHVSHHQFAENIQCQLNPNRKTTVWDYYSIFHLFLQVSVSEQFSAASESMKIARRLFADGQTFVDSITSVTSAEAFSSYRSMDQLDANFIYAICELPLTYNRTAYTHILQEFGTHIITKVRLGNITVKRTSFPQTTVLSEALKTSQTQGVEVFSIGSPSSERMTSEHQVSALQLHAAMDSVVRKSKTTKQESGNPAVMVNKIEEPIGFTLREIAYFVTKDRISAANLGQFCQHLSDNDAAVQQVKMGLVTALTNYAQEMAAKHSPPLSTRPTIEPTTPSPPKTTTTAPRISLPTFPTVLAPDRSMNWPKGTYGLLEPMSGCPNAKWRRGFRSHDSEDSHNRNNWELGLDRLTTSKFDRESIQLNFCVKTQSSPREEPDWPEGSYCLFKKGSCPAGFYSSYIDHDDEDSRNRNLASGVLPDGFYSHDTRYYFCCRNDGEPETPIPLPTAKPFFLLRQGTTCQEVEDMDVQSLWLFSDCEDRLLGGCRLSNPDVPHPGVLTVDGDFIWHFCYYSPEPVPLRLANSFMRDFSQTLFDYRNF